MAGETLAWRTIKPGHKVLARDGAPIGTVGRVLADDGADIFHGVSLKRLRPLPGPGLEITADRIERIEPDVIHTTLALDDVERLRPAPGG
jgi:hypothetical protein